MYTLQQIRSFAPDTATADRAQGLATTRKWRQLEGNTEMVWGECKGSGTAYYKTAIQWKGPQFYCSCPSRKFPCKHVIGLFLLHADQPDAFNVVEQLPGWVKDRVINQKPSAQATDSQKKTTQQKNFEKRLQLMNTGLDDLEQWISDAIAAGLAATKQKPLPFWESLSARMVDAKLAGISRKIKTLPYISSANLDWPEKMLTELANIYLVIKGFKNLEQLPLPLQQDLLSFAGVNIRKETVFEQPAVKDQWMVMGAFEGIDDNLSFRRTWFKGFQTEQWGLLLEFNFGDSGFSYHWKTGSCYQANAHYYPSNFPLRFLLDEKEKQAISISEQSYKGHDTLKAFFDAYAKALAANPWLPQYPTLLNTVTPVVSEDNAYILDKNHHYIPLHFRENTIWQIMAISGGHPINLFGEWTGERLIPLSVAGEDGIFGMNSE